MNLIPAKRQRIVDATNVIFHVNQQICIIKNSTLLNKKFQRVQQLQKKLHKLFRICFCKYKRNHYHPANLHNIYTHTSLYIYTWMLSIYLDVLHGWNTVKSLSDQVPCDFWKVCLRFILFFLLYFRMVHLFGSCFQLL